MSKDKEHFDKQMKAARVGMDRHREALSALATSPDNVSSDLQDQLEVARQRMKKYQAVHRTLAK